jgi:hypothetical protein
MSKNMLVAIITCSIIILGVVGYLIVHKISNSGKTIGTELGSKNDGLSLQVKGATSENTGYQANEEGMPRDAEVPEPAEFEPAVWTMDPIQSLAPSTRKWSDNERPAIKELPDTLRWDYFKSDSRQQFNKKEKEILANQGFYLEEITPLRNIQYDDMIDQYSSHSIFNYGQDYSTVPLFITSDYLLHVYHVVFDRALQQAEERKFYFQLLQLTKNLCAESEKQIRNSTPPGIRKAALGNIAFFSVAGSLLDTAFVAFPEVNDIVSAELQLILKADGFASSPLFQEKKDYSQFKPRGHYTKTKRLSRYFQAMMWFGQCSFPANSKDYTMMALLQTQLLDDTHNGNSWKRISRAINYLVGNSDDLTWEDYQRVVNKVYGSNSYWEIYSDEKKLDQFMSELKSLPTPKLDTIKAYRFMGQRFTPDTKIFNDLTSPRVGSNKLPRNIPTGLDVMAILGSSTANDMVKQFDAIPNYSINYRALKSEFSAYPDKFWKQSVYLSWLNTLKALLADKGDNYPVLFRGKVWSKKRLLTALASWVELKHDTILYSKQSAAEMGEGGEEAPPLPPQPKSYVEPDLEFFNRFVELIQTTAKTFSDNMLLSDEYLKKFSLYLDHIVKLRDIVRKELMNAEITKEEYNYILNFTGNISSIVIPEGSGDIIDDKFKQMALVADVHTDKFDELVLEEGIGIPQRIYVAVKDNSGGTRICIGYVYTYYEFVQPLMKRLNDDEWKTNIYPTIDPRIKSQEPEWVKQMRIN